MNIGAEVEHQMLHQSSQRFAHGYYLGSIALFMYSFFSTKISKVRYDKERGGQGERKEKVIEGGERHRKKKGGREREQGKRMERG